MMKTKTPRPRSSKSRRASAVTAVVKKEGSSPSGELPLQLEHVSLFPFLSDRPRSAHTPFEELLEESRDRAPPLPTLQPQSSPMDADEPVEEKDCYILSQDFFCWRAVSRLIRLFPQRPPVDNQQITPVHWGGLSRDDSEEELRQSSLQKRGSYVSQSAVALRCRVIPPPCIKNPYLNTDPRIDDDVFC